MDKYFIDYEEKDAVKSVAVEKDSHKNLYLHKLKDNTLPKLNKKKYDFLLSDYEKLIKKLDIRPRQYLSVLRNLENWYFNGVELDNNEDGKYDSLMNLVEQNELKKLKADRKLIPTFKKDWFDVIYINGGSGAGKTKFLVSLVNTYVHSLKKKDKPEIFLVSKKAQDAMIDKNIKGVQKIDPYSLLEEPMTIDELPDKSILIFDDFEGYQSEPKLFKLIMSFLNDLITMGRTKLLKVFIITHQPSFGKQSTLIFMESTYYVFYPSRSSFNSLEYMLTNKLGMSKNDIDLVKNLKRVTISKYPKYMIYDKYIKFF